MIEPLLYAAAIGSALVAGIFYGFSVIVMRGFARIDAAEATRAMQAINVVVLNAWFFSAFFGTALLAIAATIYAVTIGTGPAEIATWIASALYLFGCIGVTIAGNVPLNDRLANATPGDEAATKLWAHYLVRWTTLNHIRTAASLLAAIGYLLALTIG